MEMMQNNAVIMGLCMWLCRMDVICDAAVSNDFPFRDRTFYLYRKD